MKIIVPDEILLQVEKPARYTGNELNMVKKDPEKTDILPGGFSDKKSYLCRWKKYTRFCRQVPDWTESPQSVPG